MAKQSIASVEDAFFAYAKSRTNLSPQALSESLKRAEAHCRLKQPLLGTTDPETVNDVLKKVFSSKILRLRYGKNAQLITQTVQLYYAFIRGYRPLREEDKPDPEEDATDMDFDGQMGDVKHVNFNKDASYTFTRPISYTYKGQSHAVKSWNALYVEICGLLFQDHRDALMRVINGDIPGYNALAFADGRNAGRMRVPKEFAAGYYLESNMDATSIVKKIRGLHRLCGLTNELQIAYCAQGNKPITPPVRIDPPPVSGNADEYWQSKDLLLVDWVGKASYAFTKPEAYEYNGVTYRVNQWGKLYVELCAHLFEDKHDAFMAIMNGDVPGYNVLAFADEQQKDRMTAPREFAKGYYLESNYSATGIVQRIRRLYEYFHLEGRLRISYVRIDGEKPPVDPVIDPPIHTTSGFRSQLEATFRPYLLNVAKLAEPTAANYPRAIESVEKFILENGLDFSLDTADPDAAQKAFNALYVRRDFKEWNSQRHHLYTAALGQYVAYLRWQADRDALDWSHEMIIKDAIIAVLKEADAPLAIPEILARIEAGNLYEFHTDNPAKILYTMIRRHTRGIEVPNHAQEDAFECITGDDGKTRYQLIQEEPVKDTAGGETVDPSRWITILREDFPDGYTLDDPISRFQAEGFWQDRYQEACPLRGAAIDQVMKEAGTVREGRAFYVSEEDKRIISTLCAQVNDLLNQYTIVYCSCLYERYRQRLAAMSIYTEEAMTQQLLAAEEGNFYLSNQVLAKEGQYPSVMRDVKAVLREQGGAMTLTDIAQKLWFIPRDTIRQYLLADDDAMNIGQNTFMLAEHFPLTRDDAERVANVLSEHFAAFDHLNTDELLPLMKDRLPGIAENISGMEVPVIVKMLEYYLKDRYTFKKAMILPKGASMNLSDLFQRDSFTLAELEAQAAEKKLPIYWEGMYRAGVVRVSQTEFVHQRHIHFDVKAIDLVLSNLCPGDYLPLNALSAAMMLHLPACGHSWNGYLLQSYVFSYSELFRLIYMSFGKTGYYGAMVRRSCKTIADYDALVERALTDDDTWQTQADALALLISKGYQAQAKYKDIDSAMERARRNKAIRDGR